MLLQLNLKSQEKLAGDYNVNVFIEREDAVLKKYNNGLNSNVKLSPYESFCKEKEFKNTCKGLGIWTHD